MNQDVERILFTEEEIKRRVHEMGQALTQEYQSKAPLILTIMKGSLVFTADLMREIDLPCTLEAITLSSYQAMATSSGKITLQGSFDVDVDSRDVIVVEDILDTGHTLDFLLKLLNEHHPASLKLVVLFDKPERRETALQADLVGFTIPDAFVVGYGLDYNQKYRNLPYVGILKPSVYSNLTSEKEQLHEESQK